MASLFASTDARFGRISKAWVAFFVLWCFQLVLGAIWLYLNSSEFSEFKPGAATSTFFTYDAMLYRERAIEFAQNYSLFDLSSVALFVTYYGLNYSVITILGSFAQTESGFNDWYIFFANSALLAVAYQSLYGLLKFYSIKPYGVVITLALFLYIPFSLIQLNKEIIGFTFIVLMMNALHKKSRLGLLLLCITFGLLRIQYLAMALILIFFPRPRLFLLLLFINLAVYVAIPPSLSDWGELQESIGSTTNTLGMMMAIDNLAYIPVVGVLGYLSRIMVSIFIGFLSPIRIFVDSANGLPIDIIYHSSIILLSVLFVVAAFQHYQVKKYKLNIAPIYYTNLYVLIVFSSVNSMAPFLQPRYYVPLVLLLAVNQSCFKYANKSQRKLLL